MFIAPTPPPPASPPPSPSAQDAAPSSAAAQNSAALNSAAQNSAGDVNASGSQNSQVQGSSAQGAGSSVHSGKTKNMSAASTADPASAVGAATGADFAQALASSMNAQVLPPPPPPPTVQGDAGVSTGSATSTLNAATFAGLLAPDAPGVQAAAHAAAGATPSQSPAIDLATAQGGAPVQPRLSPAQTPPASPQSAQVQTQSSPTGAATPATQTAQDADSGADPDFDLPPLSVGAAGAAQPLSQASGKTALSLGSSAGRAASAAARPGSGRAPSMAGAATTAIGASTDAIRVAWTGAGAIAGAGQRATDGDTDDDAALPQTAADESAGSAPAGVQQDVAALAGPLQAPAAAATPQAVPAKANAQTVSQLSAQIVQTVNGNTSSFDMTLHPEGLGEVQVKVSVDRNGAVTARMSFSNPQAAAELGAKADDLKTALAQAGFTVPDNGLSFDMGGQSQAGGGQGDWSNGPNPNAGRAFIAARDNSEDLLTAVSQAAARLQQPSAAGLDIRI